MNSSEKPESDFGESGERESPLESPHLSESDNENLDHASNPDYLLRLLQFNLHFIHFLQIDLFKIVARIPNFYFSSFFDKSH